MKMMVITKSKDVDRLSMEKAHIRVLNRMIDLSEIEPEDYILVFEDMSDEPNFIAKIKSIAYFSNKEVFFVYKDKIEVTFLLKDSRVVPAEVNYEIINKDLVDHVIYDVDVVLKKSKFDDNIVDEILSMRDSNYLLNHIRDIKLLAIQYMQERENYRILFDKYKQQEIEIASLNAQISQKDEEYKDVLDGYNLMCSKFRTVSKAYKQVVYSEESYPEINLSSYDNMPTIIYIKDYEELIHFDTFCITLKNAINKQLQSSCKIVRLVGTHFAIRANSLSKWYCCNKMYNKKKVQTNDLILKGGDYSVLMDYLLKNELGLDFLVIIDDLGIEKSILTEGKYFYFNMCRNIKHLNAYDLNKSNTIVNNSKDSNLSFNTLNQRVFKDCSDLERYYVCSQEPAIIEIIHTIVVIRDTMSKSEVKEDAEA